LAKAVARKVVLSLDVFFQVIKDPSMRTVEPKPRMINVVQVEDWQAPILAYLCHHYEPNYSTKLTRMQKRAEMYQIIGDELYKTSVTGPLLRCLSWDNGKELLTQTRSGVRGGHIGARAFTANVFKLGFYWPSIIYDPSKLVTTCQACQKFLPNTQAPSQPTQLITHLWPLLIWGIDILGPLTVAQGNYKYAMVAVEYFTKRIEVRPLVNIAVAWLKRFFWQNKICHFGVPKKTIVDNTKQFDYHIFKGFCHQMGVKSTFASVYHPSLMEQWKRQMCWYSQL
jgi:hypothetical protein